VYVQRMVVSMVDGNGRARGIEYGLLGIAPEHEHEKEKLKESRRILKDGWL